MTFPLMALAVGAIVAGFVGIPGALGGNTIEHFLEPSFTAIARSPAKAGDWRAGRDGESRRGYSRSGEAGEEGEAHSRGVELGLMGFSVLVAADRHRVWPGSST